MSILEKYKHEFSASHAILFYIINFYGSYENALNKVGGKEALRARLLNAEFHRTTVWRFFREIELSIKFKNGEK